MIASVIYCNPNGLLALSFGQFGALLLNHFLSISFFFASC